MHKHKQVQFWGNLLEYFHFLPLYPPLHCFYLITSLITLKTIHRILLNTLNQSDRARKKYSISAQIWSQSRMHTIYTADPATLRRFDRFWLQQSHCLAVQEQKGKNFTKANKKRPQSHMTWKSTYAMLWWDTAWRSIFHCQKSLIKQISQSGCHGCVHDSWELLTYALHGGLPAPLAHRVAPL